MTNNTDDRWCSTELPKELDADKLAEAALGLLYLTFNGDAVWKGLDFNLMNVLHEKGWISDPVSKAKSVVLTMEGRRVAKGFMLKHFGKDQS